MRIRFDKSHATDRQMYWLGEVYDVPDKLGEAWIAAGLASPEPEPYPAQIEHEQVEEDE
jgi:hypothetical protein